MKTKEQEQIEQQAQTISALSKKVEGLERDLEKCLEPGSDSDTTRLLVSHDDDLRTDEEKKNDYARVYHKAVGIIAGLFRTNNHLSRYERDEQQIWLIFLDALFYCRELASFWQNSDFRQGVRLVAEMVVDLTVAEHSEPLKTERCAESFMLGMEGGDDIDDGYYRAVFQIREAIKTITMLPKESFSKLDFNRADLVDIQINFDTISSAQKMLVDASKRLYPKHGNA